MLPNPELGAREMPSPALVEVLQQLARAKARAAPGFLRRAAELAHYHARSDWPVTWPRRTKAGVASIAGGAPAPAAGHYCLPHSSNGGTQGSRIAQRFVFALSALAF